MTQVPDVATKRRFLRYVAFVLILAVGIGSLTVWWLDRQVSAELDALRAEIRARGMPLGHVELFGEESTENLEVAAWLEEFSTACSPRWRAGDREGQDRAAELAMVSEEAAALGLSSELEPLEDCLASEAAGPLFALALEPSATLEDPAALSDCQRALARLLARFDPAGLAVAARAAELPHLRVSDYVQEDRPAVSGMFFPQPPAVEFLMVVQRLAVAAELAALAGDAQASARYLEAGFRAAAIVRDLPWLMPLFLWSAAESQMLEALRQSLPGLPADADLGPIARHLEVLRPLELTRAAVVGERAITDGLLGAMESGEFEEGSPTELDGLGVPSWSSWSLKRDHLHYLRESEAFLADLERPWPEVREGLSRPKRSSGATTDWLCGSWPDVFERTVVLDSERLKALAALRAHRTGVKSTRVWLEGQRDPLTNRPFRRREESGEVWILERESEYSASHEWRLRRGAQ